MKSDFPFVFLAFSANSLSTWIARSLSAPVCASCQAPGVYMVLDHRSLLDNRHAVILTHLPAPSSGKRQWLRVIPYHL